MPEKKDVVRDQGTGDPMQGTAALEVRQPSKPRAYKNHLEGRSWVKHRLIRELALNDKTGLQLAKEYGVSANSIYNFKRKFAIEIEEVRNNLADEYAGVWVAQKMERIRQYQEAAEEMAAGKSPRNAEVLVTILKAVAEELGQLPARTQVNVSTQATVYEIVGLSPEDI